MTLRARLLLMSAAPLLALASVRAGELPPAVSPAPAALAAADLAARFDVAAVEVQRLDVPRDAFGRAVVGVSLGGQPVLLELEPFALRGDGFRVRVQQAGGALVEVPAPPPATWRGTVAGVPGSRVAASLVDGRLEAEIDLGPGLERWGVQPASDVDPARDGDEHVVYAASSLVDVGGRCGVAPFAPGVDVELAPDTGAAPQSVGPVALCQVGFEVDHAYFQLLGGSVARCVADVEMVLNIVGDRYLLQTGIQHVITEVVVRADAQSDPYTAQAADLLLDEMTAVWNSELTGVQADVGHLFTGRSLAGSTIGIAWVGVVCNPFFAYGLSESRYSDNLLNRLELTQHELGHNWSALHCDGDSDCGTMCSAVDSCGNDGAFFGVGSLIAIANHKVGKACLAAGPPFLADDVAAYLPLGSFNQWRFRPIQGGVSSTLTRTLPVAGDGGERRYRFKPPAAATDGGVVLDVARDDLGRLVLHRLAFPKGTLAGSPVSVLSFPEPPSLGGPGTILDQPVQPPSQVFGPFGSTRVEASIVSIWGRAYGDTEAVGQPVAQQDLIDWTVQVVLELQDLQGTPLAEQAVGFKLRLMRDVGPVRVIGGNDVFALDSAILRDGPLGVTTEPVGATLDELAFDLPGVFTLEGASAGSVVGADLSLDSLRLGHDLSGGLRIEGEASLLAPPFGTHALELVGKGRIQAKTGTSAVRMRGRLTFADAKPIVFRSKAVIDADSSVLPVSYKRGKELDGVLGLAITPEQGPAVGLACEPLVDVTFKSGASRTLGAEGVLSVGAVEYAVVVNEKRRLRPKDGSLLQTITVVPAGDRRKVLTLRAVTPADGDMTVIKLSGRLLGLPVKVDPAAVSVTTSGGD